MKYLLILISIFTLFSCENSEKYIQHEKGFEYLFYTHNESAEKPKLGDIMVLDMKYYLHGDSLLFSSRELSNPFRMKLKRTTPVGETIDDALSLLHIGDSASFKLNASNFYRITKQREVPMGIKQSDIIIFYVKLVKLIKKEKFEQEIIKNAEQEANTPEEEEKLLKRYLQMSNITVEPTNSGLYFVEDIKGKGAQAKNGSEVTLHYSGYFINGKSFSSTYEIGEPFTFTLGKTELISGFEEGISMMRKKGHYTLVIPSYLAYGQEGNETIPPNKTLVFEIDILDIK